MATELLRHQVADLLEERGWRWRRGSNVRGWQDPLKPDGELLGIVAAIHCELRREERPGEEFDRAMRREGLLACPRCGAKQGKNLRATEAGCIFCAD